MSSKQALIVIVLMAVFSRSVVMAALKALAAVATPIPSPGLPVQQITQPLTGTQTPSSALVEPGPVPKPADAHLEQAR